MCYVLRLIKLQCHCWWEQCGYASCLCCDTQKKEVMSRPHVKCCLVESLTNCIQCSINQKRVIIKVMDGVSQCWNTHDDIFESLSWVLACFCSWMGQLAVRKECVDSQHWVSVFFLRLILTILLFWSNYYLHLSISSPIEFSTASTLPWSHNQYIHLMHCCTHRMLTYIALWCHS